MEDKDVTMQEIHEDLSDFGFESLGAKDQEEPNKAKKETKKVLPSWMKDRKNIDDNHTVSVETFASMFDKRLLDNVKSLGVTSFFPVQTEVIPAIFKSLPVGGDFSVCAPTGSGKTLTYALPIVQTLLSRIVIRLRALILLPTRDLARQVEQVIRQLCEGTDLKVCCITGQSSFKQEQEKLVKDYDVLSNGNSCIDILVATPGRLVDHIEGTPKFTLEHLQFLVIDEADRLLQQSYQEWLDRVLQASHNQLPGKVVIENGVMQMEVRTVREVAPLRRFMSQERPLQKLLFSATLTSNPKKLASLKLNNPQFFAPAVEVNYKMPPSLIQYMVECKPDHKPLILIHMLKNLTIDSCLCFTSSVEATHRLALLLKLFLGTTEVAEYSSNMSQKDRSKIVNKFKNHQIKLVIASDVMSRGLDFENVDHVINYDVPTYIQTYIHRCGRTARAGKQGTAWTFLSDQQVHHFREILHKAEGGNKLKKYKLDKTELEQYRPKFEQALLQLKQVSEHEHKTGNMITSNKLPKVEDK